LTQRCAFAARTPHSFHIHARCVTCAAASAAQSYLNGIDVPGIFLWNTLVVKLLGSVGAVAGGLAVGKEGPFVHAGACLGALISQVIGGCCCCQFLEKWNASAQSLSGCRDGVVLASLHVVVTAAAALQQGLHVLRADTHTLTCLQGGSSSNHFPWFKRFWNDRDRVDMVACGAAAGAERQQQSTMKHMCLTLHLIVFLHGGRMKLVSG
jgi:hypothetical protein